MKTLTTEEAAEYLKMSPRTLQRKARAGIIHGKKTGKSWIFIQEHLADWVSGRYPEPRRELQVLDGGKQCRYTNEKKRGGYNSPHQTGSEYNNLLARKTSSRPKNCTTNSKPNRGV